tara:strand:- start:940 stop:1389 length:450 start_codon:yes stop_codon:yes gene_type:complete
MKTIKSEKINFLVLCTGNSCRSQITEGFLKHFCDLNNWDANVYSAGINAEGVNPKAVETMQEIGIDISKHSSNKIEEFNHIEFSHLITVCDHANESCPIYLKKVIHCHKNFKDPSKMIGPEDYINHCFRNCRNEIAHFALQYLKSIFIE